MFRHEGKISVNLSRKETTNKKYFFIENFRQGKQRLMTEEEDPA
jgi:hypothetical protein